MFALHIQRQGHLLRAERATGCGQIVPRRPPTSSFLCPLGHLWPSLSSLAAAGNLLPVGGLASPNPITCCAAAAAAGRISPRMIKPGAGPQDCRPRPRADCSTISARQQVARLTFVSGGAFKVSRRATSGRLGSGRPGGLMAGCATVARH